MCKKEKPLSKFYKHNKFKDGHQYHCKQCHREYYKKYNEINRNRVREKNREYARKNKKERKEYYRKYREENKEKERLRNKKYREKNREKERLRHHIYYLKNKKRIDTRNLNYNKSKRGKEIRAKTDARRKQLGFIPLFDNPFPSEINVHFHHINSFGLCVPVPDQIHNSVTSRPSRRHKILMNEKLKQLYGFDCYQTFCVEN